MVRPERRVVLAGASPVRVSAGAPGSRLQPSGEIRPCRAECRKPLKERGATSGPQQLVNAAASTNYQPKGVWEGRAGHVAAKATDSILDRNECWISPGSQAVARWERAMRNRRDHGAGRESEGFVVPVKACSKTRWREGTLLWSCRRGGKRDGMPETANNPSVKARQLFRPAIGVRPVGSQPAGLGESCYSRTDTLVIGRIAQRLGCHARHITKIIVKPCAGKPQARFERGLMETGQR